MQKNAKKMQKLQKPKNCKNENLLTFIPHDVDNNSWWQRTAENTRKQSALVGLSENRLTKTQKWHFLRNSSTKLGEIRKLDCPNIIEHKSRSPQMGNFRCKIFVQGRGAQWSLTRHWKVNCSSIPKIYHFQENNHIWLSWVKKAPKH